ncbi:MAG: 23S rRNA (uracil(1939)-C(5))-methyltransferase RlmD [Christensenella sp.]|nr:23S rRNA (uracil(1939)-C(5))-methyltransferase RlmD [Christensenella sp.]
MKKNDTIELSIDDLGTDGQGIGRYEGMAVFVPGALPGETVRAHVITLKKNYAVGKLEEILTASPMRVKPPCHVFGKCGGCTLQHLSYAGQLSYKHSVVENCLSRIGGLSIPVNFPLPARTEYRYRNKAAFPLQQNGDSVNVGFYANHSHRVIDVDDCKIQPSSYQIILSQLRVWIVKNNVSIYNEQTHTGLLRHIVLRENKNGDVMLVLCINGEDIPRRSHLLTLFEFVLPQVKSIMLNINTKKTNAILGDRSVCIYGQDHIFETLCGLEFKIGPQTFLQVNSAQTEALYRTLMKSLRLTKSDTVLDLYCGAGTISLLAAQEAGKVFGIEIVPQAVEDARFNARLNHIDNAEFLVGDAAALLPGLLKSHGTPNAVIVDPPRKGLEESIIHLIASSGIPKVGYVSCNPSTLARDLKLFTELGYQPGAVQPVDMFPQTTHVETVVLMSKVR